MQETCSCRTLLVEGALFCHCCGKAQRELFLNAEPELVEAPAAPVASATALPVVSAPLPISFSNSLAVRLCFLVASVASVLDAMPTVQLLLLLWSVCAGFLTVVLYRRATGQPLNIRDGVRMGWITGVLNSMILTVLITISVAANASELTAVFREQVRAKGAADAAALALMDNPYVLAAAIIFMLVLIFVFVAGGCMAGGALAARMWRDNRAPDRQPR